jgi:hypothetical protein
VFPAFRYKYFDAHSFKKKSLMTSSEKEGKDRKEEREKEQNGMKELVTIIEVR